MFICAHAPAPTRCSPSGLGTSVLGIAILVLGGALCERCLGAFGFTVDTGSRRVSGAPWSSGAPGLDGIDRRCSRSSSSFLLQQEVLDEITRVCSSPGMACRPQGAFIVIGLATARSAVVAGVPDALATPVSGARFEALPSGQAAGAARQRRSLVAADPRPDSASRSLAGNFIGQVLLLHRALHPDGDGPQSGDRTRRDCSIWDSWPSTRSAPIPAPCLPRTAPTIAIGQRVEWFPMFNWWWAIGDGGDRWRSSSASSSAYRC